MLEKDIEKKLRVAAASAGGLALKFTSPGMAGVPDRLVLLPKGRIIFVELKKPGEKMSALQLKRKKQLEGLGFQVLCIDSVEEIGRLMYAVHTS